MPVVAIAVSLALLGWAYLGYPLFMHLMHPVATQPPAGEEGLRVCVIIVAHNAERWISQKVRDTQDLLWPAETLQIVVASDGSTDDTVALAHKAAGPNVKVLELRERVGKHRALTAAVREVDADIIVFTDVATEVAPDAVLALVRWFQLPDVGCVSGFDRPTSTDGRGEGEGLYVRYEMWLRATEARAGSMVSASGCLFAVRRELCQPWFPDLTADFAIPISVREQGYRVLIDPQAVARYPILGQSSREFERKVRTVLHGLQVVWSLRRCLNPIRHPLLASQLLSHKVLRWMSPFLLLLLVFSTLWLYTASAWSALYFTTGILGLAAVTAWLATLPKRSSTARCVNYVLVANAAVLVAWFRFLLGTQAREWPPSHG